MSNPWGNIIRRLWSGSGYQQPNDQCDPDTLSASVDLEDIIDEYDEPTTSSNSRRRSHYASALSASNSNGALTSYRSSASVRKDDETTSFYSALQDGFSLDDFETKFSYNPNEQEFSWAGEGYTKRDTMSPASDFEVSWRDLTYTIRTRAANVNFLADFQSRISSILLNSATLPLSCSKSTGSYEISAEHDESDNKSDREQPQSVTILQQINGSFKSSELTGVLGPSGAGKTSLLNFLSRRSEKGFTGSLKVGDQLNRKIQINAIPQDDHVPEYLTVRENLMFASQLKNVAHSGQIHERSVLRASNLLGLDDCLDTRSKNISGGQQKRLAIAQELLSKPDILILDEPTSGLDSVTCLKTLAVLRELVQASAKKLINPIAVVLTIHQPQVEAFNLFDKVYVMASGGVAIYDGPPGKCIQFVQTYSGLSPPSEGYNPASFLIDIASGEYGQEPIEALARQVRIQYENQGSEATNRLSRDGIELARSPSFEPPANGVNSPAKSDGFQVNFDSDISLIGQRSQSAAPQAAAQKQSGKLVSRLYLDSRLVNGSSLHTGHFFRKTRVLVKRCWISLMRDRKQLIARTLFNITFPFCMAFFMGQEPGKANACPQYQSQYSLRTMIETDRYINPQVQEELFLSFENVGILFISIYSCISANIAAMTLIFAMDMKSSMKEHYNGWYSMTSYVFARLLSNIPLDLILPTITIALIYVTTGQDTNNGGQLQDVYRILITAAALCMSCCIGQLIGMMFGAIYMGHITTALFASQGATLPFVLLSGFVARTKNMTSFVQYLSLTSLYRHCLDIAFIARYGYNVCNCNSNQLNVEEIEITGVPEKLRTFMNNWISTQEETTAGEPVLIDVEDSNKNDTDLFQLIAKQVSFYNTYGIEIKSCKNIIPYQLYDYGLDESDLSWSFMSLLILFTVGLLILLVTIKIVVTYRTSL